jgi:hypothetical protein
MTWKFFAERIRSTVNTPNLMEEMILRYPLFVPFTLESLKR